MFRIERANSNRRITWASLLGLVLVPLLIVWGIAATTVGRAERLDQITAAIVNQDEAVTVQGQPAPMGRQLAQAIVDGDDNIDWVLVDAANADAGLASGEYAAVVTIPQHFSAAATSYAANDPDKAVQATIDVRTSPASAVQDADIARQVASMAVQSLNSTLTGGYLDAIFVGFSATGEQLQQLADGAGQLASGAEQLSSGLQQTRNGVNQLDDGLSVLDDSSGALTSGGDQLAAGADQLASGAGQLAGGLGTLADSTGQLTSGAGQLDAGASALAGGAGQVADGVRDYTSGTASAVGGFGQIADGLSQLNQGLSAPTTFDDSGLVELQTGAQDLATGAQGLAGGVAALHEGATELGGGAAELGASATQLGAGAQGLADGASQLIAGAGQLNSGLQNYQAVIGQYAAGAATIELPPELVTQASEQFVASCQAQGGDLATCQQGLPGFLAGLQAGWQTGVQGGAGAAVTGLNTPDASGTTLLGGADGLASGMTMWSQGVAQYRAGADLYAAGAAEFETGAAEFTAGVQPLVDGSAAVASGASGLSAGVDQLVTELPVQMAQQLAPLQQAVSELDAGASELVIQTQPLVGGGQELAAGAGQTATGAAELSDGMGDFAGGLPALASGIDQLSSAGDQLASGAGQLAGGVGPYVDGVGQYAAGVHQVRVGVSALAGGMTPMTKGATDLADGASTMSTEVAAGAEQVPDFDAQQRARLVDVVASPVADSAAGVDRSAAPAITLAMVLALWLGALATFTVIRPIPSRVLTSSRPTWQLVAATVVPGFAVAGAQGLLVGLVGAWVLPLGAAASLQLVGMAVLASLAFMGVNHALAAWLHGTGRLIAVALAVLTAVVGLVSALPNAVSAVQAFSPLAPAVDGIRAAITGSVLTAPVGILLAWLIGAGVAGVLAVFSKRQLSVRQFTKVATVAAD